MSSPDTVEIRSYRRVFDLERRIYRIDRMRLNPGGIPVRGVLYFILVLLALLVLGVMPVTRLAVHLLPWYMRDLALPGGLAALLTIIRVEGRPFHLAAFSLARYLSGPRQLSGLRPCQPIGTRWEPQELLFLPDGSDARLRRLRFTGPGAALVTVAHERAVWPGSALRGMPRLTLRALAAPRTLPKGKVIELRRGVCMHVHPSAPPARRVRVPAGGAHARGVSGRSDHTQRRPGGKPRWGYG
ncbi:MAG TPA: hypothetical protein VID48_12590 [Solirubrobacteraceae bacterium]|jgi:hypothetical protein